MFGLKDACKRVRKKVSIQSLLLFLPNIEHYDRLFADHSEAEWAEGAASALLDLKAGQVLYAEGVHTEDSIRKEGKPLNEWLESE